jgi:hypothetical protein
MTGPPPDNLSLAVRLRRERYSTTLRELMPYARACIEHFRKLRSLSCLGNHALSEESYASHYLVGSLVYGDIISLLEIDSYSHMDHTLMLLLY